MVQCGLGRCGMNNSDPASAEEKTITEDDAAPAVKVATSFPTHICRTTRNMYEIWGMRDGNIFTSIILQAAHKQ